MLNVLNKHNTLFNFYPSNKHLFFPKNDFNYISKAKQEYNLCAKNNYKNERKNNIKNNLYHSINKKLDFLSINNTSRKNNIIPHTTSFNFWKANNNNIKYNYDKLIEKNNNNKNNFFRRNNNLFQNEKENTKTEQKFKVNSKLFELFINDYEKKIKKTLEEIGINKSNNSENENEKNENNCCNNYETYKKNFYNLPFLNNNDDEEKNIENNQINFNNYINSYNGNYNKILQNEDVTSPRIISKNNDRNSNKHIRKVNSFDRAHDNKNTDTIVKSPNKKPRTLSSSPFIIETTLHHNIKINNYFNNNNKISNYEIGKIIGKGAYSIVKICRNKITKEKFAMKIYEKKNIKDDIKKKCILSEIEILKKLNHPNIAKLYDTIITDKYILLIQELIDGISLREYYNLDIRNQKYLSENKLILLKNIFKQIFSAFDYIHKNNISHRDIKLENILITKNSQIKIIDFGFGIYNPKKKLQKFFCGTPNYMAPEIILKKEYNGQKYDMWSLGILLYKLFCADFPFKGKNEKDLYNNIIKGKFAIKDYVPEYIQELIKQMIRLKPEQRINCEQALRSSWLSK